MKKGTIIINQINYPVHSVNTPVIGSGAAALNAAVCLYESGIQDVAIVTEKLGGGTSNNAGSDKQTYYKLSLDSQTADTPVEMARDLFRGGCMHGDIALCEAQYSMQAFYNLVRLGVPFPHDTYGAFPGYITDHDSLGRGTSAGPLTSKFMVGALLKAVRQKNIPILNKHQVISLLAIDAGKDKQIKGAIAIDLDHTDSETDGLVFFNAANMVLATGGPGGLYKYSVYPMSQTGSIGMALRIGAKAQNLTESLFGIASISHRWNLSGTYQQVIPRYFSTNAGGHDEKEFLNEFFPNLGILGSAIFLKGYQWPFDPRKIADHGSSLIDLLVYREIVQLGRRVFMDFTQNPGKQVSEVFSVENLSVEAREYLIKSGAVQETPIERLAHMNQPAIDLYMSKGINIRKEPLEIAVCAQHNNGGLTGDIWWESNIRHLFPIGEINGTHGVYRPGGSALNSGQVGGIRAAMFISSHYAQSPPDEHVFLSENTKQIHEELALSRKFLSGSITHPLKILSEIQSRMSDQGANIRNPDEIKSAIHEAWQLVRSLPSLIWIEKKDQLADAFRVYDMAITHAVYLEAIDEYIKQGGGSRGSYLITDPEGSIVHDQLDSSWRVKMEQDQNPDLQIQEIYLDADFSCHKSWVEPRPIPMEKHWFENLWREFREKGNG